MTTDNSTVTLSIGWRSVRLSFGRNADSSWPSTAWRPSVILPLTRRAITQWLPSDGSWRTETLRRHRGEPAAGDYAGFVGPSVRARQWNGRFGTYADCCRCTGIPFGRLVTSDDSTVTLIDCQRPRRGRALGGTLSVAAVNGVATFSDITVSGNGQFSFQAYGRSPLAGDGGFVCRSGGSG